MKQKSIQEQRAAEKQVELIVGALEASKETNGYWMNCGRIMPPRLYPKGPAVSPFNTLILGLHTDRNGYRTAHYTFFQEAKARGESVKESERGVPFNWYNWNSYVNRHNPEDIIPRNDYLKLTQEEKEMYKGVHNREIRYSSMWTRRCCPMWTRKDMGSWWNAMADCRTGDLSGMRNGCCT